MLKADPGTPAMIDIAKAIQEGAAAYLRRQFKTIAVVTVPLAVLVFLTATKVMDPARPVIPSSASGCRASTA